MSLLFTGAGFIWGRDQERRKNAAAERARQLEDRARAFRLVEETWAPIVRLLDVDKFRGIADDLTAIFTNSVKVVPLHSRRPDWPLEWMPLYEWLSAAMAHIELYRDWSSGMEYGKALAPVRAQQAALERIRTELMAGHIGLAFFATHRLTIELASRELQVRVARQKEYAAALGMMESALIFFASEYMGSFGRLVSDVQAARSAFERLQLTHSGDFGPELQTMQSYLERIERFVVASPYATLNERQEFEEQFWPPGGPQKWISG
ncbi:hypothetical protein ASF51_11725 [Agreia sp. Leaf283]|nr:hypothetical protein ASF51_11725 [Agreia sp. Leaf283]